MGICRGYEWVKHLRSGSNNHETFKLKWFNQTFWQRLQVSLPTEKCRDVTHPNKQAGTHEPEMFTPWKRRIILQIIIFRFRDNLVGGKSNIFGIFTQEFGDCLNPFWHAHTPWKFNSSPLKISYPQKESNLTNHHFSGVCAVKLHGCFLVENGWFHQPPKRLFQAECTELQVAVRTPKSGWLELEEMLGGSFDRAGATEVL